ncbi:hypothetical protein OH77DRAFT_1419820 [Trametes cingulata]|nr:hypothetical protein OH77DRAFT_1419820 [Trametes cingulata]
MPRLLPYETSVSTTEAQAVEVTLRDCAACNAICSRVPGVTHLRYQHVHRVHHRILMISVGRYRGRMSSPRNTQRYHVFISTPRGVSSRCLSIPLGCYPTPWRN